MGISTSHNPLGLQEFKTRIVETEERAKMVLFVLSTVILIILIMHVQP
jgi:hypothetical protein